MYLDFPKSISARLAIYSGGYQTILAPRGWRCTATEGSAEESLSIYPASEKQSKDSQIIYSITWSGDSQSGIRTKFSYAGSYFPNVVNGNTIENFIQQSNLNETISKFLAARHKSDKIVLLSDHSLSFVSPPSIAGLGSDILGYPSLLQTMGIMTVSNEPDGGEISFFVLRLRQPESDLKEDLLEFQERCFDSANWCSKIATYSN